MLHHESKDSIENAEDISAAYQNINNYADQDMRNKRICCLSCVLLSIIVFVVVITLITYIDTNDTECNIWSHENNYDCINSHNNTRLLGFMPRDVCKIKCSHSTSSNSCCKYSEKKDSCLMIQPYAGITNGTSFVTFCSSSKKKTIHWF